MWIKLLAIFCFIETFVKSIQGETCETLEVNVRGQVESFDSHEDFGIHDYESGLDECWVIKSSARIRLTMETFQLTPQDSDGRCTDYLEIYDDKNGNDDNRRLGTYCGRESFGMLLSRGNRIRIVFHSNGDSNVSRGFRINHKLYGDSEIDGDTQLKAGLIFLFIFIFVVFASVIAVFAAYFTQKKLKPKVILVKKMKGKSAGHESRPGTAGPKYDINGHPTPAGHVYPSPIHSASNQVAPEPDYDMPPSQPPMSSSPDPNHPAFQGHPAGFGHHDDQMASHRSRPTTASHIRFKDNS